MNKKYIKQKEIEFKKIYKGITYSVNKNIALAKHKNYILKLKKG